MCCKVRASSRQHSILTKWAEYVVDLGGRLFKLTMKTLGPVTIVAANVLAGLVVYILIFVLTPPLLLRSTLLYVLTLVFILWGTVNIYFNYWACMLTAPGCPAVCNDPAAVLGTIVTTHEGVKTSRPAMKIYVAPNVSYVYCKVCSRIKPPRAHHCSVSGKCILNMDHYCPWMCNCVGYHNYRYFMLFLAYMCMGSFYVVCYTMSDMIAMTPEERSSISIKAMLGSSIVDNMQAAATSYVTCAFTLALSAFVSTATLLSWHIYLIITNQTTIEFYINMAQRYDPNRKGEYRNPFDEGWRKNVRRVLGDCPWYTHLWPNFTPPAPPMYPFEYSGGGSLDSGGWEVV